MTVKMLGAALLVLAGAWLGVSRVVCMKKRLRFMADMDLALALMAGEIATVDRAIPEIFEMLAQRGPGETRSLFGILTLKCDSATAGEAWECGLEALDIGEEERRALSSLGEILGRYDSRRQSAEIEVTRRCLSACTERIRQEMAGRGKNYPALGMCAAGIAAMLII